MTGLIGVVALAGTVGGALACRGQEAPEWAAVTAAIRAEFPAVRHVSTAELASWLRRGDSPILIDAREPKEYAVSHLDGARRASTEAEAAQILREADLETPVVVYCSVGYRSSALARDIEALGFTRVFNLEGSIFRWANEGRPVYRAGEEVEQVHPYDEEWGLLLNRTLWWDLATAPPPR